jgi:hypothetical protein
MAARKTKAKTRAAKQPVKKPAARKPTAKAPKLKVKHVPAPAVEEPPSLGTRAKQRFAAYADKLLEQAETDPDKVIAGAVQLMTNTERLVSAVKSDPEGAKRALRSGVVSLAASLLRRQQ